MLRGFGEWLEEDPRGRLCMLNRRNYTRNGHGWNPMPDTGVGKFEGGFVFLEGGFAKRGVRTNPPLVTGLVYFNGFSHPLFFNILKQTPASSVVVRKTSHN